MITRNDALFIKYCDGLVSKIYKILPLFEENNVGIVSNLHSLVFFELRGLQEVIEEIDCSYEYVELLATLEQLFLEIEFGQVEHNVVKREIFKSISLVKKIKSSCEKVS